MDEIQNWAQDCLLNPTSCQSPTAAPQPNQTNKTKTTKPCVHFVLSFPLTSHIHTIAKSNPSYRQTKFVLLWTMNPEWDSVSPTLNYLLITNSQHCSHDLIWWLPSSHFPCSHSCPPEVCLITSWRWILHLSVLTPIIAQLYSEYKMIRVPWPSPIHQLDVSTSLVSSLVLWLAQLTQTFAP